MRRPLGATDDDSAFLKYRHQSRPSLELKSVSGTSPQYSCRGSSPPKPVSRGRTSNKKTPRCSPTLPCSSREPPSPSPRTRPLRAPALPSCRDKPGTVPLPKKKTKPNLHPTHSGRSANRGAKGTPSPTMRKPRTSRPSCASWAWKAPLASTGQGTASKSCRRRTRSRPTSCTGWYGPRPHSSHSGDKGDSTEMRPGCLSPLP